GATRLDAHHSASALDEVGPVEVHGTEHVRAVRQLGRLEEGAACLAVPDDLGDTGERRQVQLAAVLEDAVEEYGGAVGDEVTDRWQGGGPDHEHLSPVLGAAHQGDRPPPAAHGFDVGVVGGAAQQRVGV